MCFSHKHNDVSTIFLHDSVIDLSTLLTNMAAISFRSLIFPFEVAQTTEETRIHEQLPALYKKEQSIILDLTREAKSDNVQLNTDGFRSGPFGGSAFK